MNPMILLLGLLGTGAMGAFMGGSSKSDGTTGGKGLREVTDTNTDTEEPTTDTSGSGESSGTDTTSGGGSSGGTTSGETTIPTGTTQTGSGGENGGTGATITAQTSVDVIAGRVTTLEPDDADVSSVRIVSGVEYGKVTVNPDNSLALVMTRSEFVGNQGFSYEVTHSDGSTSMHQVNLNVTPGLQGDGWATGEYHYMLETDENDNIIVEAGDNHTKVYVSGSTSALSRAEIAQLEGVDISQVTGQFLAINGYGQSEDLALDQDAGMALWNCVTPRDSETSNWFLLERGYSYDEISRIITGDASGEDELHPLYIGAWGEGSMPELTNQFVLHTDVNNPTSNVVIQGIMFSDGLNIARMDNLILDGIVSANGESVIGEVDGATIRNSSFLDAFDGDGRTQGLYMGWESYGVLLEGNFFDGNGWDMYGDGQDPTMFSHNVYLQYDLEDVTVRDSFILRGASAGIQVRSGGFVEDNVFIENQSQLMMWGGDYKDAGNVGYYSLVADNLITSAGHKSGVGAYSTGFWDNGALSSYVDNIVTHLADPNGNEDWKIYNNGAMSLAEATFYNDTIVYNWQAYDDPNGWGNSSSPDQNIEGLDTDILDQTTIQIFTAMLLGQSTATVEDFSQYLRAQYAGEIDGDIDADTVIRWFQQAYGIALDERTEAAEINFVPSELGEGIRWDNRLNWDSGDLPGANPGDNVNLGGNDVVFGGNSEINELDLGQDGWLNVYGGRMDVNGGIEGDNAQLNIEGAGQIWVNGSGPYGSDIDITISSGRFVNTGAMTGTDLFVSGSGADVILATDGGQYDVAGGHTLSIQGAADVGFDDNDGDMAILDFAAGSTLSLGVEDGELGSIAEFRSGAFGDGSPNVQSGIDLGNATLEIDLSGLSASAGNTLTLMSSDELVGLFDQATVGGLGARNATIIIDYVNDSVTLQLSSGNGQVSIETVGEESDVSSGYGTLWDALTADQGVFDETAAATLAGDEEDLLLAVA